MLSTSWKANPPQNVPEPLPSSETPFKPPALEQHGVSSHTGTVIAETVVTHKLRKTSAVEAVDADAVLTQAAETASAKPVSDDAVPPTKRMQKLERKSEKAHERLDAAREKLPTHKVLKKERVFDEETGKGKTRLHFEDELKKPKGKGKLQFEADKTVRKVGDTLASGIHGKIHEVEQENSAVEAAHKTEIAAEIAARHFRHHRESSVNKPYEKVSKLEHKADVADAKLQYERNQQEHPEMKKQNMNKHYQKQSIKKEYGYAWAGVLPAGQEAAEKALEKGCEVYRLYSDNTEGLCVDAKEIADHAAKGGMLGISKESWMAALEKENYLKAAEMSMEDDYGMIDGIINNGPKEDKTAEGKAPETSEKSSIMDRLKSAKAEKQKDCCPPKKHKGEIEL